MSKKAYVIGLLNQHKTFLLFYTKNKNTFYSFTWDEKNQEYEEFRDFEYQSWEEMLQICQWGETVEMYLEDGEILIAHKDAKIEDEIISNYIRKDYRKQCRALLAGKKRERFTILIQDTKETLNGNRAEKLEAQYNLYPKLPEEWDRRKIGEKEGYLMTGFFSLDTYVGTMGQLLEFMENFATFEMALLYCPETKTGIMQFDRETPGGRWYWLK